MNSPRGVGEFTEGGRVNSPRGVDEFTERVGEFTEEGG